VIVVVVALATAAPAIAIPDVILPIVPPCWNFTFSNAMSGFCVFISRTCSSPILMVFTTVHTLLALFFSVMLDFISVGTARRMAANVI
jgi:hypothetical protein